MKNSKPQRLEPIERPKPKDWNRIIEDELRVCRHAHKKYHGCSDRECEVQLDLEGALRKRRLKVLKGSLEDVNNEHPLAVEDWVRLNINSHTYSEIEDDYSVLLAAAIWILDRITEADIPVSKIAELLPKDEFDIMEVYYPDIWDSRYDSELIAKVVCVLYYRNEDISPLESDGNSCFRVFTSNLSASGRDKADVPSRQAFESLIQLIPENDIQEAVTCFKDYYDVWVRRYFSGVEVLCEEYYQQCDKVNEYRKELNKTMDLLDMKFSEIKKNRKKNRTELKNQFKLNPVLANPVAELPKLSSIPQMPHPAMSDMELMQADNLFRKLEELDNKHNSMIDELTAYNLKRLDYSLRMQRCGSLSEEFLRQEYGEKMADTYEEYAVPDPYMMCFALLYQIENNSNIPWLYGSCIGMMMSVLRSLPWAVTEYDDFEDEVWMENEQSSVKPAAIPDWYERAYKRKGDDEARSLAQIVYEATGCIMPRDLHKYDSKLKMLGKYGIRRNNAIAILYCMNILGNARRQLSIPPDHRALFEEINEQMTKDELEAMLRSKEQEIQQLKSALHSAEKKAAEIQKKLSEEKKAAELEHRELADLREIIFNNDNEQVEEEVKDKSVFPYDVQNDTVVFGGHESWVREIKQLLDGNIRFIAKELNFDVNIIRYADIVWIQSNAIPHHQYYRVVNTARLYNKPVRYFKYASAAKSAEQLADNDREN